MFPIRDENPTHRFPLFTVLLIALNIAVFAHELSLGEQVDGFIERYAFIPTLAFAPGQQYRIFTSMFLHAGLAHLLGNMWFLWLFGDNIEDTLGKFLYLLFYLACGVTASLVHWQLYPHSSMPTVGASGAISGVLAGYLCLHPFIRIKTLVVLGFFWNVIYIPAFIFLIFWFLMQVGGIFGPESQIAFGAHIGGFLSGFALILALTTGQKVAALTRYANRRIRRF